MVLFAGSISASSFQLQFAGGHYYYSAIRDRQSAAITIVLDSFVCKGKNV
jgi:hypothetical protein